MPTRSDEPQKLWTSGVLACCLRQVTSVSNRESTATTAVGVVFRVTFQFGGIFVGTFQVVTEKSEYS